MQKPALCGLRHLQMREELSTGSKEVNDPAGFASLTLEELPSGNPPLFEQFLRDCPRDNQANEWTKALSATGASVSATQSEELKGP